MSDKAEMPPAPLPDYYEVEDAGNDWNLWCKQCDKGWSLPKGDTHPGNVLRLLDHARSHQTKKGQKR